MRSTLKPRQSPISSQLPSPPPSPRQALTDIALEGVSSTTPKSEGYVSPVAIRPDQLISNSGLSVGHLKPEPYDESQWSTILKSPANLSNDPLFLRSRVQDQQALSQLRKRGRKGRKFRKFYETQNEHIAIMLKTLEEDAKDALEHSSSSDNRVRWAIRASFIVNCILAVLQLYAAVSSLSLSFFATALDAVFDPCANLALNYAHRYATRVDLRKYPSGGSRFETIGNIIYSGVMGCASVVLVVESVQSLSQNQGPETAGYHIPSVVTVCVAFLAKLALFFYCWAIRNEDSQVRVLWEDHRNDLFINGFGIFTNAAGAHIKWWIDPLGALLISLALIGLWGDSMAREFRCLAGQSAPVDFLQQIIYKAMTFSPHIEKIDSCRCYHVGPKYFVEIDIVMDGNTPLWLAHDLGQELQNKIEALADVDRAFVHLDHEVDHKPEHRRYT